MNREALVGMAVVVLAVAVMAAFGLGLTGGTTFTEVINTGELPDPPSDGSAGIVIGLQTEPHSILGFHWGRQSQQVIVQVVVAPECADRLEVPDGTTGNSDGCPAFVKEGEYAGGGVNRVGDRVVAVRLDVSRECFDAVSYGDQWPHASQHCADGSSPLAAE